MSYALLVIPFVLILLGIVMVGLSASYSSNQGLRAVIGFIPILIGIVLMYVIYQSSKTSIIQQSTNYQYVPSFSTGSLPKGYEGYDGVLQESDLINNFSRLSWQNAEDLVGLLFQKKGYHVKVTQRTGDFGIDVEATNGPEFIGIQVKNWVSNVDYPDIAKTCGGGNRFTKVMIVSTKSGFTSASIKFANKDENRYRLELWDSNRFKQELRQHVIGK